jgi:hypothetical protein
MEKSNKEFEGMDKSGNTVKVLLKSPSSTDHKNAEIIRNKAFRVALESGALLRQKLDDFMKEQNIWNDKKQAENDNFVDRISDLENKLLKGGCRLSEGHKVALELRSLRLDFRSFLSERNQLDQMSCEGQADNARFAEIVRLCLLDPSTGKPFFLTQEDYDASGDEPWVLEASGKLAGVIYGLDPDYDNKLTENKFLKEFDFVNDDLESINKDGHLVDSGGRLINEEGRYVAYREDDEQYFVNRDGEEVVETSDDGWVKKALATRQPFLDENDKPIISAKKEDVEKEEDLVSPSSVAPKAKKKPVKKAESKETETSD